MRGNWRPCVLSRVTGGAPLGDPFRYVCAMVDLQRLELEKKRYRRESLSLTVAVFALIVSLVATAVALQPLFNEPTLRAEAANNYLKALSSDGVNDPLGALAFAEANSPAARFANTVASWRHAQTSETVTDGKVSSNKAGQLELCPPKTTVPLFSTECVVISNIEFSDDYDVIDFTIDQIPINSLVRSPSDKERSPNGAGPMRIYTESAIISPDGSSATMVLELDRRSESDRQYPVTLDSVTLQDNQEEDVPLMAQLFPSEVGYWETNKAVVQVPRATAFMYLCWAGVQDDRGSCDWILNLGFSW